VTINIHNGTRPTARLCDSCRYSHITEGPRQGEELVMCESPLRPFVPKFVVVECNRYRSKLEMSREEATDIGWVLHIRGGRPVGFKPPEPREETFSIAAISNSTSEGER
jgi:hypothetical protein